MRYNLLFAIPLIIIFRSCGCSNKPVQNNAGKTLATIKTTHQTNFNCNTLKKIFSKSPYKYIFRDEKTLGHTSEAHCEGKESQPREDLGFQNSIIINFDKNTRRVKNVVFYINHANNDVKPRQLTKLFEFLDYFDPKASEYIRKNFSAVFYDLNAHNGLAPYENRDLGLKMVVVQSLFDSRRFRKNARNETSDQDYIAVSIVFT
jgi:hypothetical protein